MDFRPDSAGPAGTEPKGRPVTVRFPHPCAALLLACALLGAATAAAKPVEKSVDPEAGRAPVKLPDAPAGPFHVELDVIPGDPGNTVIAGSDEGIPVAILSAPGFDASEIEPASLVLAGALAARGAGQRPFSQLLDVDGDGLLDLLVQFRARALSPEADGTVRLAGRSGSGQEIEGSDVVAIVSPGGLEQVGIGGSVKTREIEQLSLRVFPNPARGPLGVSLALSGRGTATVELLDVTGRRIERREVASGSASARTAFTWAARLEPGRYLVRVTQGSRVLTKPVTVLR